MNQLEYKLQTEKADSQYAVNKLNKSLEVIKKIEGYIKELANVLNKARLFNEGLAKHPIGLSKVILVLADFNVKMEELLDNMRSLFHGLELNQELPLNEVANISFNMEEIHSLAKWEMGMWNRRQRTQNQINKRSRFKKMCRSNKNQSAI